MLLVYIYLLLLAFIKPIVFGSWHHLMQSLMHSFLAPLQKPNLPESSVQAYQPHPNLRTQLIINIKIHYKFQVLLKLKFILLNTDPHIYRPNNPNFT